MDAKRQAEIKHTLDELARKVADALCDAKLEPSAALGTVLQAVGENWGGVMGDKVPAHGDLVVAASELDARAGELREQAAELEQQTYDPDSPYQTPLERAAELRERAEKLERVVRWFDGLREG